MDHHMEAGHAKGRESWSLCYYEFGKRSLYLQKDFIVNTFF